MIAQHSTKTVEHFTPARIVSAARQVLGEIDLDPASCTIAQETVCASAWYGEGSAFGVDGLAEPWAGRVLLNPPGGAVPQTYAGCGTRSSAALWWGKLATAWAEGEVEAAIFIGFAIEILCSAQALPSVPQPLDFPLCVPAKRIAFDTVTGDSHRVHSDSPTHANVIVFLPPRVGTVRATALFAETFRPIGKCRT